MTPDDNSHVDNFIRGLCQLYQRSLQENRIHVIEWIERAMLSSDVLMELAAEITAETQDYLLQFHFLKRYRKLSKQQMALTIRAIEDCEQVSVLKIPEQD
jgi:hypothetical protein